MQINYTARKVNLHDNFKELVEKKLSKFKNIFSDNARAYVTVKLEKNRQTVEITIKDDAIILRAEYTCREMNEALDEAIDNLSRQIRKNKSRLSKKLRSKGLSEFMVSEPKAEEMDEDEFNIIRTKQFMLKPITVDEAILQMNMLNHSFFVFKNCDREDMINIVYKRKSGNYGLLEPEV